MLKKLGIILIICIIIFSINLLSWFFWGQSKLLEQGIEKLVRSDIFQYHEGVNLYIVPSYKYEIINYNFKTKIPEKKIISITSVDEREKIYKDLSKKYDETKRMLLAININIVEKNFIRGGINFHVYGQDWVSYPTYYIWLFYDWIEITYD